MRTRQRQALNLGCLMPVLFFFIWVAGRVVLASHHVAPLGCPWKVGRREGQGLLWVPCLGTRAGAPCSGSKGLGGKWEAVRTQKLSEHPALPAASRACCSGFSSLGEASARRSYHMGTWSCSAEVGVAG